MIVKTILEWVYEPAEYFETTYNFGNQDYVFAVDNGKATVTLSNPQDPVNQQTVHAVQEQLNAIFVARQMLIHKPYRLNGPHTYQYRDNGSKDVSVSIQAAVAIATAMSADVVTTDENGNIVRDTKAERIAEHTRFLTLVAQKSHNPLLQSLLQSYNAAVNDPANELVHLYEVRDALAKHFGNEGEARKQLNITKAQWQRVGFLANEEPLEQGRHRGKHHIQRRPATTDELSAVRALVRNWIEAYALLI
jgi:hypothetical protein